MAEKRGTAPGTAGLGVEVMRGLREEHARFGRVFSLIGRDARRLVDEPGKLLPLFREAVSYVIEHQNLHHHPREQLFFEKIQAKSPELRGVAARLELEHRSADLSGGRLKMLIDRAQARGAGRDARRALVRELEVFANRMRSHIGAEEKLLYSQAAELLTAKDWREIAALAPPDDVLAVPGEGEYPLLAHYMKYGSPRSTVSVDRHWTLSAFDSTFDRLGARRSRIRNLRTMLRRQGREALELSPVLHPMRTLQAPVQSLRRLRAASQRWRQEWGSYLLGYR